MNNIAYASRVIKDTKRGENSNIAFVPRLRSL